MASTGITITTKQQQYYYHHHPLRGVLLEGEDRFLSIILTHLPSYLYTTYVC